MQKYQGDISLIKLDKLPENIKLKPLKKDLIVAYGEVTGHHHKLKIEERGDNNVLMGQDSQGNYYLQILNEPVELTHQQHKTQILEPGIHFVGKQYEYDEITELKRVID